jgi:hypothetical protein
MLLEAWFATKTNRPAGSTATAVGREPVANGEPATGASIPVLVFAENSETLFADWLFTNNSLCTESKAMNSAPAPAGKGEPLTGDMAPFSSIAKAETVPEPELLTKAKLMVWPEGIGEGELFIIPQPTAKTNAVVAPIRTQTDDMFQRERLPSGIAGDIMKTISESAGFQNYSR